MLCSGFSIVAQCHHYQIVCFAFKGPDRCKSEGADLRLWGGCDVTSDTIVISSLWHFYVVGEFLCHGFQGNPLDMACSLCSLIVLFRIVHGYLFQNSSEDDSIMFSKRKSYDLSWCCPVTCFVLFLVQMIAHFIASHYMVEIFS